MSCLNYFVHSPQRQIDDRLTEWWDFMRPTSGIEFCLQSQTWGMNLVWMEEAAVLLCSFIFLLVLIQTEATRWRLNNITPPLMGAGLYPAIMGKITHGCSSGSPGNLWSLHLHTNSFIPALHKQKMPRAPLPFMCTFAALTTLVFMPLSLSPYLEVRPRLIVMRLIISNPINRWHRAVCPPAAAPAQDH